MPWPPPPIPRGPPSTYLSTGDAADWQDTQQPEASSPSGPAPLLPPGTVVWRAGEAVEEAEVGGSESVAFELAPEWAARFAQTELRRAQRAWLSAERLGTAG